MRSMMGNSIRMVAGKDGEPELALTLTSSRRGLIAAPGTSELVGTGGTTYTACISLSER
jgi:hypothetical protein